MKEFASPIRKRSILLSPHLRQLHYGIPLCWEYTTGESSYTRATKADVTNGLTFSTDQQVTPQIHLCEYSIKQYVKNFLTDISSLDILYIEVRYIVIQYIVLQAIMRGAAMNGYIKKI